MKIDVIYFIKRVKPVSTAGCPMFCSLWPALQELLAFGLLKQKVGQADESFTCLALPLKELLQ
jgi:hypothetical protein